MQSDKVGFSEHFAKADHFSDDTIATKATTNMNKISDRVLSTDTKIAHDLDLRSYPQRKSNDQKELQVNDTRLDPTFAATSNNEAEARLALSAEPVPHNSM